MVWSLIVFRPKYKRFNFIAFFEEYSGTKVPGAGKYTGTLDTDCPPGDSRRVKHPSQTAPTRLPELGLVPQRRRAEQNNDRLRSRSVNRLYKA
jgi:hypothetical protein